MDKHKNLSRLLRVKDYCTKSYKNFILGIEERIDIDECEPEKDFTTQITLEDSTVPVARDVYTIPYMSYTGTIIGIPYDIEVVFIFDTKYPGVVRIEYISIDNGDRKLIKYEEVPMHPFMVNVLKYAGRSVYLPSKKRIGKLVLEQK